MSKPDPTKPDEGQLLKAKHPTLLLVRHARAVESHPAGDFARGLDEAGRKAFRKHAKKLAKAMKIEGIATSPLVRAVQTAEILADACGISEVLIRSELAIAPGTPPILGLARELGTGWALVGHNPSLPLAAAEALGVAQLQIRMKKGAAVALALRDDRFAFCWIAAPGRSLKKSLPQGEPMEDEESEEVTDTERHG